jgi:hypothetical protein
MNLISVQNYISKSNSINELSIILNLVNNKLSSLSYKKSSIEEKIKPLSIKSTKRFRIELENFIYNNFSNFDYKVLHANHWRQLQNVEFDKNLIFIQLNDGFEYDLLRSFSQTDSKIDWQYRQSEQIKFLISLAKKYTQKTFVLLTSLEFIEREINGYCDLKNLIPICIGGDIFLENEGYNTVDLILKKEVSNKHVVCLNNYPRPHRVATILYLIYKNLDKHCNISFMSNDIRRLLYSHEIELEFYNISTVSDWIYFEDLNLKNDLESLSTNLKNYKFLIEDVYLNTHGNENPNVFNFSEKLFNSYQKSLVEIITESTCFEPSLNLTEKYTNSIYGCNFPIFISSQDTVQYLRKIGFDTFDDIIDHSYDNEINPFYRLKKAIDLNSDIISNCDLALELFEKNKQRFVDNKNFYETKFYDIINDKRQNELLRIKKLLNL